VTQRVVGKTNENRCVPADQLYINEKLYFQPSPQFDNFTRRPQYQYPITLIWWRGWVPLMPGVGDLANIDLT